MREIQEYSYLEKDVPKCNRPLAIWAVCIWIISGKRFQHDRSINENADVIQDSEDFSKTSDGV